MEFLALLLCVWIGVLAKAQTVQIFDHEPIPPGDKVTLNPSTSNYPTVGVDLLWKFSQDIEIRVIKFAVDGQKGDFVLISKHAFPSMEENVTLDDFLDLLPIDETILLSWDTEVDTLTRVAVGSSKGAFIYFHAQLPTQPEQLGLELEVMGFLRKEEEPTPTTEPIPTIPPGQHPNDYVTKFLTGKIPNQFLAELDTFKSILADMTNKYCDEKGIQRPGVTVSSDVHVPMEEIRFCDRSWPKYKECVEVTFAIVSYDVDGYYVMRKPRIDEMWEMYSSDLVAHGYFDYSPPKGPERTVGWLWAVGCLGSVLLISIVLCLAWLKKATDELNKDAEISRAMAQVTDEEKFYDRGNPVHQIRKTMVNGRMSNEDDDFSREKFHELSSSGQSFLPPFNEVDDAAAVYRVNQLYVPDEDEDEEEYFRKPNMDPPAWHEHGIPRPTLHHRQNFEGDDEN